MLDNHGVELLPGLPDATEYIDTAERLDMVPLHDTELGKAVEGIKIDEAVVRLTPDLRVVAASMELPLPLVPVHTRAERRLFNRMMLKTTKEKPDFKQMALTWCSSVDGRDVYPKHDTHLRLYFAQWERNSRARKATEQAAKGVAALKKFNAASPAQLPAAHQPRVSPNQLPPPPPEGARAPEAEAQIVGGMLIGPRAMVVAQATASTDARKRKHGQRGPDKIAKKRRRHCGVCKRAGCPGSGERALCNYKGANKQGKRAAGKQIANKKKP